jgi:hypothetical protein
MRKKIINRVFVDRVISLAGGDIVLSYKLTESFKKDVSQFALRQWRVRGIPDMYWQYISNITGVTVDEFFEACGG